MPLLFVAILLLIPVVCSATGDIKCNLSGTQIELNACAKDDFAQADKELNDAYRAVVKMFADDKLFISRLKLAQKSWIQYRDADLDAYFACSDPDIRICFGSMFPLSYFSRKTAFTRERTNHLNQIIKHGRGE